MERFRKITGNVVLAIQVLIVFVLIFENQIAVPPLLQAFGRMHPLLLHLPIGLLLVAALVVFAERFIETGSKEIATFLLYLVAITCSLTTLMGLFLSREGGYETEVLQWHKWMGVLLSFLTWVMIIRPEKKLLRPVLLASCILIVFTGHYGATLTHGESFISAPLYAYEPVTRTITDSTTVFSAAIEPVLEAKCFSCHNEQKKKGKLVLTSPEAMKKGGKNGKLWIAGKPAHSLIVERLTLPMDAKEHMPPRDKAQLTQDEINFIGLWIEKGADTKRKLAELAPTDTLRKLSKRIIARYFEEDVYTQTYPFDFVAEEKLKTLSTPDRSIFQIAKNEPALAVDFYLRESFHRKNLEALKDVSKQIVSLNLTGMPVEDADLQVISRFIHLEKLVLNNTNIEGKSFDKLAPLKSLTSISLSGTKVSAESLKELGQLPSLKHVYVWNTALDSVAIKKLKEDFDGIDWHAGYTPDPNERLKLNSPLTRNDGQLLLKDEPIMLKHNLPGTVVRYTLDGTEPDSIASPVYEKPIDVDKYTIVKTKAFKDGWLSSDVVEYVFFVKGKRANAVLDTSPEPKYEGEGAATLTDGVKGMPDFYKDPSWIGFRNNPLVAHFTIENDVPVKNITISYARNVWAMCMPPKEVEVWAGPDKNRMKLISKTVPRQPDTYVSNRTEGVTIAIPPSNFRYYKIVAKPLAKLPAFRNEKKEKGWLMVDEIYFN
jgi:hypothetical protein